MSLQVCFGTSEQYAIAKSANGFVTQREKNVQWSLRQLVHNNMHFDTLNLLNQIIVKWSFASHPKPL